MGVRPNSLSRRRGTLVLWIAAGTWMALCGGIRSYAQSDEAYRNFQNPPADYSMCPLVRVNDRVDPGEARWQLQQMKQIGIDGLFILPESLGGVFGWKDAGMPYEYLSPAYFQMVREFVKEAQQAGIRSWVYDERDWPSGHAGGKIVANPQYRSKVVSVSTRTYQGPRTINLDLSSNSELLAIKAYRLKGAAMDAGSIQDLSSYASAGRLSWTVPQGRWQVALYHLELNSGLSDNADADLLNPQAMREFIEVTHRQYYEQVEKVTGISLHGTFTDEPHIASFRNYLNSQVACDYLPWTSILRETFRKSKGYDILDFLPLLYLEGGPETARVRCDFWQVVSKMFEENYFGQIAKFDHSVGWTSTGHLNGEEDFWWHLIFDGGNEFANQRQFDYPGLDWILPFDYTADWGIGWLSAFAGKFVSSVAHVYGKPRVMAETFAGAGLGLSLEQMHRMVNWEYVLGVNMLVPITYKYSLRGADRVTSYPPGISYQQPWWSMSKPFNDFVTRLSYLLSQGRYQPEIAILLPVPDVWANSQDREYLQSLTWKTYWVTNGLLRNNYDFDFVDDDSLQQASMRDGAMQIGKHRYQVLLLPPSRVMSMKTLDRVKQLHRAGGRVIGLDRFPTGSMEQGDPDPRVTAAVKEIFEGSDGRQASPVIVDPTVRVLIQTLESCVERPVLIAGQEGAIYSMKRAIGASDVFFLTNSTEEEREFDAAFKAAGTGEIWDPETGARFGIPGAQTDSGRTRVHLLLRPYESLFVVFNSGLGPAAPRPSWTRPVSNFDLRGKWKLSLQPTLTDPHLAWNFSPLPEGWKLKAEDYSKIHDLQAGNWTDNGLPYYSGKATYEKTFDFGATEPHCRYLLDLGRVGVAAQVWLNGKPVGTRLWRPYAFDVTDAIKPGENSLRIVVANTLANYFSQFEQLKDEPLYRGGSLPWMLPSGLMGPVTIRGYAQ